MRIEDIILIIPGNSCFLRVEFGLLFNSVVKSSQSAAAGSGALPSVAVATRRIAD